MKKNLPHALKCIFALFVLLNTGSLRAQYLVESELITSVPSVLLTASLSLFGVYDINYYKITYNTVDVHGQPTIASGGVAVPATPACDVFPMMLYCHGTVLRKQDVPSTNNIESQVIKVAGGQGFVAIAPDYLGLGDNPGIHPYVHAESQATASIDMYYAAREFMETLDNINYNGQLFVTGYSQGGHAAMATLKYAQDNDLVEDMGIVAGAPLSGPYNLSGSQAEVLLSDEPYTQPGYVIYLLKSYELAYGNIYNELSDIIQHPYDSIAAPFFDGVQNEFNMSDVNVLLNDTLSRLLVDTVLSNLAANDNHPIWKALRDNDNYDWTPSMPLFLGYCDGDEQVPFQNAITAQETMLANGATYVTSSNILPGASHVACIIPSMIEAIFFFQSMAMPCGLISSATGGTRIDELKAWPNPAKDNIRFALHNGNGILSLYDLYGREVHQENAVNNEMHLDVSNLSAGMYIAVYRSESGLQRVNIVIE